MTAPLEREFANGPRENGRFTTLRFDPALYTEYVADCGLTDAEQDEMLRAIWQVVVAFVDMGFGVHPVQIVLDESKMPLGPDSSGVVSSLDNNIEIAKGIPGQPGV